MERDILLEERDYTVGERADFGFGRLVEPFNGLCNRPDVGAARNETRDACASEPLDQNAGAAVGKPRYL